MRGLAGRACVSQATARIECQFLVQDYRASENIRSGDAVIVADRAGLLLVADRSGSQVLCYRLAGFIGSYDIGKLLWPLNSGAWPIRGLATG